MYGASYSRVEIDLLSGELNVLELHQSFDIGDPVNLGIELGQIEGKNLNLISKYLFWLRAMS